MNRLVTQAESVMRCLVIVTMVDVALTPPSMAWRGAVGTAVSIHFLNAIVVLLKLRIAPEREQFLERRESYCGMRYRTNEEQGRPVVMFSESPP